MMERAVKITFGPKLTNFKNNFSGTLNQRFSKILETMIKRSTDNYDKIFVSATFHCHLLQKLQNVLKNRFEAVVKSFTFCLSNLILQFYFQHKL